MEFIDENKLNKFRLEGFLTDFTIVVGEEKLKAHKIILATSSEYLKTLFKDGGDVTLDEIVLNDLEPMAIKAIISFCYGCELDLTIGNIRPTSLAATKFQVRQIQILCKEFIDDNLGADNCSQLADLSRKCNMSKSAEKALNCSLNNFGSIINENLYPNINEELPPQMLSNLVGELNKLKAILEWTEFDDNKLNKFRLEGFLTDFTIVVGEEKLQVHKIILATSSEYFKTLFQDVTVDEIVLNDLQPMVIKAIISICYGCELDLTLENILPTSLAATKLQVRRAQRLCEEFAVYNLEVDNCLQFADLSRKCNMSKLAEKALNCCRNNFKSVIKENLYLNIDEELLLQMISNDRLDVDDEMKVLEAIIEWIAFDDNRSSKLEYLLAEIRMTSITASSLAELKRKNRSEKQCSLIARAEEFLLTNYRPSKRPRMPVRQRLYLFDGRYSSQVYDPIEDEWTSDSRMKVERYHFGATVFDDSIYIVGGKEEYNSYAPGVARYDLGTETWFDMTAEMKQARSHLGVVTLNGYIYAIGGLFNYYPCAKVEKYDPLTNVWADCAPLQKARFSFGVAVYEHYIFAIGGEIGQKGESMGTDTVEMYDSMADTWQSVASMSVPRIGLGCCTCGGRIFAIGGDDGDGEIDSAEVYDPVLDTWTQISPMKLSRAYLGVAELGGLVYAVGGEILEPDPDPDDIMDDVEVYDPKTDSWIEKKRLKTAASQFILLAKQ